MHLCAFLIESNVHKFHDSSFFRFMNKLPNNRIIRRVAAEQKGIRLKLHNITESLIWAGERL